MDINKEIMPEQTQAAEQESESIERARELFEYEMTEVLLNFKGEMNALRSRDRAAAVSVGTPKAEVAYTPPEIELSGVDCPECGEVSLSGESIRADVRVASVEVPPVPEVVIPAQKAVDAQTAFTVAFSAPPKAAEWAAPEALPVNAEALYAAAEQALLAKQPENAAYELAAKPVSVEVSVPSAEVSLAFEAPVPTQPDLEPAPQALFDKAVLELPAVKAQPAVSRTEFSTIQTADCRFELGEVTPAAVGVSVAEAEAVALPSIRPADTPRVSVRIVETSAPEIPELPRVKENTAPVSIPTVRRVKGGFTAPPKACVSVKNSSAIPVLPDCSGAYKEITETLKSEI